MAVHWHKALAFTCLEQKGKRKMLVRIWKLCIFIFFTVVKCLKIQVMSIQYSGCLCIAWGFAIPVISLQKPFYQDRVFLPSNWISTCTLKFSTSPIRFFNLSKESAWSLTMNKNDFRYHLYFKFYFLGLI